MRSVLRRTDWLAELQQVLLAGMVLLAAAGAIGLGFALAGAPVHVGLDARSVLPPGTALAGGLVAVPDGDVMVRIDEPDAGQVVLHLLRYAPVWLVSVLVLFLLWRLVRLARRTDPFSEPVVRRLVRLGWLLVVGGPAAETATFLATFALAGTLGHPQATLTVLPLLQWMLVGAGMLAAAEVIRRGLALRAELDTVV